jgi:signal recognition particle receptor subunit beta
MVFFNYSTMQMAAKVVYYGPGLCGKTTNLHYIYGHTTTDSRGEMVSLETETDRTLFFDLLPLDVGSIAGFNTRIQLYTVPGQVFYNTTRKLVLKGVDGVVFVVDSQRAMLQANLDSFRNLEENLAEMGLAIDSLPLVLQYNKRDLADIYSVEELNQATNRQGWPHYEASAVSGHGVFETLKGISKYTLLALKRRLGRSGAESGAGSRLSSGNAAGQQRSVAPPLAGPAEAPLSAAGGPAIAGTPGRVGPAGRQYPPAAASYGASPASLASSMPPAGAAALRAAPSLPTAGAAAAAPPAPAAAPQRPVPAEAAETMPLAPLTPSAPFAATSPAAPARAPEPPARLAAAAHLPASADLATPDAPALPAPLPTAPIPSTAPTPPTAPAYHPAAAEAPSTAAATAPGDISQGGPPRGRTPTGRSRSVDVLSELEKLRREAMRPTSTHSSASQSLQPSAPARSALPSTVPRPANPANPANPASIAAGNGRAELSRNIEMTLKRADFARARRFLVSFQVEDEQHRVVDAVRDLQVEIKDTGDATVEKLLLRLNIALHAKE